MRMKSRRKSVQKKDSNRHESVNPPIPNEVNKALSEDLAKNEEILKAAFKNCSDIVYRPICSSPKALLIYIDGFIDTKELDRLVLTPLISKSNQDDKNGTPMPLKLLQDQLLAISQIQTGATTNEVIEGILKANFVLMFDGENKAMIADLAGFE